MPPSHASPAAVAVPLEALAPAEPRRPSAGSRILFTIAALLVYRVGTYIPLPGIDPSALTFPAEPDGFLGTLNMLAGAGIHRMAVFALNLVPLISALIIVQLLTALIPDLKAKMEDGQGRKAVYQWTRYLTAPLAVAQSYGVAVGLESVAHAVAEPGLFFRFSTVITLAGGAMFLMWLGEQITSRGIGNGILLIILSGIVAGFPAPIAATLELGRMGALPTGLILGVALTVIAVIAFIVFMERARRRPLVLCPGRQAGDGHLTLKLNGAGAIAPICVFSAVPSGHFLIEAALIVFFTFFCTRMVFDPQEMADDLRRGSGFVPGIGPGAATATYLNRVQTRISVIGAVYLAAACVLPELLLRDAGLPFHFSGSALLIVVIGALEVLPAYKGRRVD